MNGGTKRAYTDIWIGWDWLGVKLSAERECGSRHRPGSCHDLRNPCGRYGDSVAGTCPPGRAVHWLDGSMIEAMFMVSRVPS
jgi:hypothetical protein